jgi:dihydroorotase
MELRFPKPDDMHVHLRDGEALAVTVPATAQQCARAMVMPNLKPGVTTTAQALAYRDRILAQVPAHLHFQPLMTLYLHPTLSPDEIERAKTSGAVFGVKFYPQGATTHAESGLTELSSLHPTLAAMESLGLPLLIHGEAVGKNIDIYDREKIFLEQTLAPLIAQYPKLKIVLEHITTQEAVHFIEQAPAQVAATITVHHLLYNRSDMLAGGLKPHLYCMPLLKREHHRQALIKAATSGNPKFFMGTDSAPHELSTKLSACGCAGVFSALSALELYAQVFDEAKQLDKLPDFASRFGAAFYGLPQNTETVTLRKQERRIPEQIPYFNGQLIPLCAGQVLPFTLEA